MGGLRFATRGDLDRMFRFGVAALLLALFTFPSPALSQQTGTLMGTVTTGGGTPVAGAQVSIPELERGTVTRSDGTYVLPGLAVGDHTLRIEMLGYRTQTMPVTVTADRPARHDFALEMDLLDIEAIVVTGTQVPRVQVEAPIAISIISPDEIEQANPRSTTEMLRYVPGFTRVESSGGEVNQNITMRGIRASST